MNYTNSEVNSSRKLPTIFILNKSTSLIDLNKEHLLKSLQKGTKTSKSEESGYDSDTVRSVDTKSPKSSDKSKESDSSGLGGYASNIEIEPYYQVPRKARDTYSNLRSTSNTR